MLKQDEKIIFSIKSGFSLKGLDDYKLEDKCLQITNLGNIYISKVCNLAKENSDFIMYDFDAHRISLCSEVDQEGVNIVAENLPFTVYERAREKSIDLSILIVLDFEEFVEIENQLENMIFDFKEANSLMILDGKDMYKGDFFGEDEKITFNTEKFTLEVDFNDVEYFTEEYNRITFSGYFYVNENINIVRKISFIGDLSKYKLPLGFELKVELNNKIGFLPFEDEMVLGKIRGHMGKHTYDSQEVFIRRHKDMYIFYDKKNKEKLLSKNISAYSKYSLSNDEYIIYDEENVYNMKIDLKSLDKISLNKASIITNKYIGYTNAGNPFFIKIEKNLIKIGNSNKNILEIDKSKISDIKVKEEKSIEDGDLVNTEIKFSDRKLDIKLKRNLIAELTEDVFSDYQVELFNEADTEEIYENWVKTISDMVIYDVFGEVYSLSYEFLQAPDYEKDIYSCIEFVNKYYLDIEKEKKKIDKVTLTLAGMLEKNEIKFLKSMGIEREDLSMEKIRKILLEVRNNVNYDFNEVINKLNTLNYLIMPEDMIEEFCEKLGEHDIYLIKYFVSLAQESLEHFVQDNLPFYIENVVKSVFELYMDMYSIYIKAEEGKLRYELMNRIKSAHIFKQFAVENNPSILRKEVIKDLYSLVKFSSMREDSEFYYTSGYN